MNCPKCRKELVLKEGRYGRFLACPGFPECRYTAALWTFKKPYCEKCKGSELLPFIKDGKVIPNAQVYCECHNPDEIGTRQRDPKLSDFDFPCSYAFRSYYEYELTGRPLPPVARVGGEPPIDPPEPEPPPVVEHIHRHSDMGKQEFDLLQQTALKLADHLKPKSKPQKTQGVEL